MAKSTWSSIALALTIGAALRESAHWLGVWLAYRKRLASAHSEAMKQVAALVAETRRLLAKDPRAVDLFIAEFGHALGEEFSGEPWLADVTIADLRNHVECAVFGLVQGCPCGNCSGVSEGGDFWVEARFGPRGIVLGGGVNQIVTSTDVACDRKMTEASKHPMFRAGVPPDDSVSMVCACGSQVVTNLDYIAKGKKPVCAACLAGKPSA